MLFCVSIVIAMLDNLIGFVIASKRRMRILRGLAKKPKRPMELVRKLKYYKADVSRELSKLEKKELVKCLTPERKAWRVFMITDLGKEVLKKL